MIFIRDNWACGQKSNICGCYLLIKSEKLNIIPIKKASDKVLKKKEIENLSPRRVETISKIFSAYSPAGEISHLSMSFDGLSLIKFQI